ncbi:MAG: endonuclease III [Candidatus Acetothermia bacterium]|jgi:endonuclease-3|nr:endonuclease III [Candidatus Acetothermia bacterium]MDH7505415.1 endonuclease III [Candidatus Acetothermia bacterium]
MELKEAILEVARRLGQKYGRLEWRSHGDPLDVLIKTILSQNTNDANRDRAYAGLKARFPTWEAAAAAPVEELAEAIQPGGLHHEKARRIKKLLQELAAEKGGYSLSYLEPLSTEEALAELLSFEGVGKKTAGVVLLFSLGKPYFPVDTHIGRIARRLGWIEGGEPHDKLNPLIPDRLKYQLHLQLIRHGREICRARRPRCADCVLSDLCPSAFQAISSWASPSRIGNAGE